MRFQSRYVGIISMVKPSVYKLCTNVVLLPIMQGVLDNNYDL